MRKKEHITESGRSCSLEERQKREGKGKTREKRKGSDGERE